MHVLPPPVALTVNVRSAALPPPPNKDSLMVIFSPIINPSPPFTTPIVGTPDPSIETLNVAPEPTPSLVH